jgi:hypothetical protein
VHFETAVGIQAIDEALNGRDEIRVEGIKADLDTDVHEGHLKE